MVSFSYSIGKANSWLLWVNYLSHREEKRAAVWDRDRLYPQFSHNFGNFESKIPIHKGNMAEGARFELADPLRGLQFSRLARSAAPSPLRAKNHRTSMVKRQVYEKKNFTIVLEYDVDVLVLRLCDLC